MKWRLFEDHFHGAGNYRFGNIALKIDANRIFEFEGEQTFPLYSIAAMVGSKRDIVACSARE